MPAKKFTGLRTTEPRELETEYNRLWEESESVQTDLDSLTEAFNEYVAANDAALATHVQDFDDHVDGTLPVYGMMYTSGGGTPQTGFDSTPQKVTGFEYAGINEETTPNPVSDQITVGKSGTYLIAGQISFSGSVSAQFELHVYINNGSTVFGTHRTLGTGGDVGSCSIFSLINLSAGDTISIYGSSNGSNDSFTLVDGQMFVLRLT